MQHIRAVKQEKIREFTEKTSIAEIALVSAQSGDGVHALFRKITATVLGLRLGRADFEQDIVAAQVGGPLVLSSPEGGWFFFQLSFFRFLTNKRMPTRSPSRL